MPQVAEVTRRSTFSFNKIKENESTEIHFLISGEDVIWLVSMHRSWAPSKIIVFLRYFPNRMNFCNKSQTPNKIPLIILSQKHAHYEHLSSLSFLLFNSCHIIARLIFVAFNYGVEILAKRTSPPHVIRPLVLRPDFTSIPLTPPIFQSPANTQTKFQPPAPPQHLYTSFSIWNELALFRVLSLYKFYQKNNRKNNPSKQKA